MFNGNESENGGTDQKENFHFRFKSDLAINHGEAFWLRSRMKNHDASRTAMSASSQYRQYGSPLLWACIAVARASPSWLASPQAVKSASRVSA
jgi:hypothetical protein